VMRRLSSRYKLLFAFLLVCSVLSLGAWAVLAATICSNPHAPVPETQQVVPYNCHGMTVFISETQVSLLHWLFPIFALFSLITVITALLTLVRLRISVQVQVTNTPRPGSERAP